MGFDSKTIKQTRPNVCKWQTNFAVNTSGNIDMSGNISCLHMLCRVWRQALRAADRPEQLASWVLLMLQWVSTFICKCVSLQQDSMQIKTVADAFATHLTATLGGQAVLAQMVEHLSGSACASKLGPCQGCPTGAGISSALP